MNRSASIWIPALGLALMIGVALRGLWREPMPRPVREFLDERTEDWTRQALAVSGDLPQGSSVLVFGFAGEAGPENRKRMNRLRSALEKRGLTVHLEALPPDITQGRGDLRFPMSEWQRLMRDYPDMDAAISLCGPPAWPVNMERDLVQEVPALLITRAKPGPALDRLLRLGVVDAVAERMPGPLGGPYTYAKRKEEH